MADASISLGRVGFLTFLLPFDTEGLPYRYHSGKWHEDSGVDSVELREYISAHK